MSPIKRLRSAEEVLDTLLVYGCPESVLLTAYAAEQKARERYERAMSDKYRNLGRKAMLHTDRLVRRLPGIVHLGS